MDSLTKEGKIVIIICMIAISFYGGHAFARRSLPSSTEAAIRAEKILYNGSYAYLSDKWKKESIQNYINLYQNYNGGFGAGGGGSARLMLSSIISKVCYSPDFSMEAPVIEQINHSCIEVCTNGFS